MLSKVEVLTIFPQIFESFLATSLVRKQIEAGKVEFRVTNIRDYASPPHFNVDDSPYGGGPGMVMRPEPLVAAIEAARSRLPGAPVVLFSPAGRTFSQTLAREWSRQQSLILVCGRYEGVDQRVVDLTVDVELSIGDYILMGGEVPAMVVTEACLRLVEGTVGNADSLIAESFEESHGGGLLEAPQYTRPPVFRDLEVPEVLRSGDHAAISRWRNSEALRRTTERRPDLLRKKAAP